MATNPSWSFYLLGRHLAYSSPTMPTEL